MSSSIALLKEKFENAKKENPKLRIRDHAHNLGVSEAELLATNLGEQVIRLENKMEALLQEIKTLGRVTALTRNEHCVHERKGIYNNVSFDGHVGLVLDTEIDLRLFMTHWRFAFAVNESERLSFQFFDKSGEAVHKVFLTDKSERSNWFRIVALFKSRDQNPHLDIGNYPDNIPDPNDEVIAVTDFHKDWLGMTDTHQFFGILRKHQLGRQQALRLAPEGYTYKVANTSVVRALEQCSNNRIPIMIFVSNRGCIQIHSGEINRLVQTGPWYNILDPELNLHLRTDAIHSSYVVRKPSEDGIITSLELYDQEGSMIVQFFGKRKPGVPEITDWTKLMTTLTEPEF
jgi:putative hemin transport protein